MQKQLKKYFDQNFYNKDSFKFNKSMLTDKIVKNIKNEILLDNYISNALNNIFYNHTAIFSKLISFLKIYSYTVYTENNVIISESSLITEVKKNIIININIKNKQIYFTFYKNKMDIVLLTLTTGVLLKFLKVNKNNRRTKYGLSIILRKLKIKVTSLLKKNYFFTINIIGYRHSLQPIYLWIADAIKYKNLTALSWNPSISYIDIKKKRYASIKKNMKKRLLKKIGF